MPQIPDFISTVASDVGGISRRVIADRSIDTSGVLQPLQQFTDKYLEAKRVSETADYQNANTKALADLEMKWSKVADRQQAMAGFDADVAKLKAANVDTINDPLMRAAVGTHFSDQATSRGLQTGDNAFRLESSAQAAKLDQAQLDNADLAGKAGNENLRVQIGDQMNKQIDAMAAAGWITPEDAVRRKGDFNNNMASVSAQQDIEKNPYAAKKSLEGEGYKGLIPQERQQLVRSADAEIHRRENEARQQANEAKSLYIAQQRDLYEQDMAMAGDGKSGNLTSPQSLTRAFGADSAAILWANLTERRDTAIAVTGMGTSDPKTRQETVDKAKPSTTMLPSADISTLNLTPKEENLYQYHVKNVTGGSVAQNADGSYSSVSQTSQEHNGRFYNIPTVWDGQHHTEDQAVARADQQGWDQWPDYATRDEAEARYAQMHPFMEKDQPGQTQGNIRYKEQAANYDALARANATITKAYQEDPAQAAISFSPQVNAAVQAANADPKKIPDAIRLSVETQHHAGVPDGQERILTKDQATAEVNRINAARGDQATTILNADRDAYGQYWNKTYGELVAAGLAPGYQVLATMPPGAASDAAKLTLSRMLEAGPDATKTMAGTTKTAVDNAVDDVLTDWTSTIQYTPDGPRLRDQYGSAIRLVADSYTLAGMEPKQAAQRAASELLLNKYDMIVDAPHYNARAPKGGQDLVQTFSMHVESTIKPSDLPDPDVGAAPMYQHPEMTVEDRKLDYWRRAIAGGTWVTNEHDNGWRLLDQSGLPVRLANGNYVTFTYADAEAAGYTGGIFGRHPPLPKTLPGGIPVPQFEEIKPIETPGVFKLDKSGAAP